MSGDRQHFLPRVLLRGFCSRTKGKETYTWVFRRGRRPFETNIINIGVSNDFYTLAGDAALDDSITTIENTFGSYINELRAATSERQLEDRRIPELITHFLLRTKHLRDAFGRSTRYLFDSLLRGLERPEVFEKMLLNHLRTRPEEVLEKVLEGRSLNQHQKGQLLNFINRLAPALIKAQSPQIILLVRLLKDFLREKFARMVKESHIKSLAKNAFPQARVEFLRGLKWLLIVTEKPGRFILGDVAVATKIGPDGKLKPVPDTVDDVTQVWLPISDTHLITGAKALELLDRDVERINMGTASLSHDFFVSGKNDEPEKSYASALATDSSLISDEELQTMAAEVLAEFTR